MDAPLPVFDAWHTACAYADALAASHAGPAVWESRRDARLRELLTSVAPRASAYRERLAHAGIGGSHNPTSIHASPLHELHRLRPVTKRELMADVGAWVTDPEITLPTLRAFLRDPARRGHAFLDRYVIWESSGSSGEPAIFVQDARSLAVADALEAARGPVTLLGDAVASALNAASAVLDEATTSAFDAAVAPVTGVPGFIPSFASDFLSSFMPGFASAFAARITPSPRWNTPPRIALVGATDGHFAGVVAFERARALNPWLAACSRSFSFLQPIEQLVAQLKDFAPTVLASYPSMAWVLSQEQQAGRLDLDVHAVWTGGETLTPAIARALSQRFRAPVHDSYGTSECFLIANTCRHGSLHLNADWVVLEAVDEAWQPVPDGEVGATTLLTNLANHVQPVIRYDLGDRVRFVKGGCECGSSLPVIEVQGRCDDVITLQGAAGRSVHLAPLALTTVLEDEAGVFDFQLRPHGAHALRLDLYGPRDDARDQRAAAALRAFVHRCGATRARVDVHHEPEPCGRGRSGKQQRVCSNPLGTRTHAPGSA